MIHICRNYTLCEILGDSFAITVVQFTWGIDFSAGAPAVLKLVTSSSDKIIQQYPIISEGGASTQPNAHF